MAKAKTNEIARWLRFPEIGCVACQKIGVFNPQADVHHLLSGNRRRGHLYTIPLCPWHHRGVGNRYADRGRDMGPSLAHGSKPFREMFGSDDELLEHTNLLIQESRASGG